MSGSSKSNKSQKRKLPPGPTNNPTPSKGTPSRSYTCPVCEEVIKDSSDSCEGDDSVFCDGLCQTWFHRKCAGLTKKAFLKISKSHLPFICYTCTIKNYNQDISSLKSLVEQLTTEMSSIRTILSTLSPNSLPDNSPVQSTVIPTENSTSSSTSDDSSKDFNPDRKYNVIIFGIEESPPKTSKYVRSQNDLKNM